MKSWEKNENRQTVSSNSLTRDVEKKRHPIRHNEYAEESNVG